MALSDYLNGPKYRRQLQDSEQQVADLHSRYAEMEEFVKKCGAMEALEVQKLIEQEHAKLEALLATIQRAEQDLSSLTQQSSDLKGQILVLEEFLLLESFALYVPKFKLNASHEYKTRLDEVRDRQKAMIKSGEAATGNMDWQVNGSKAEGRKLVNDMLKLVIRSFNNECDYCVDNVKFNNIELGEKRIRQSFDACNRLGRVMTVRLSERYLDLKLDELHLAHEFQVKKQEEKEQAKRVREELREQQKLEQEIRAAREKIAKERVIVAAFGDPGLGGLREALPCPVTGLTEAALASACLLGGRFSIVAISQRIRAWYRETVQHYGLESRLASIRALDETLADIGNVQGHQGERLVALAQRCVREDGADVIVLAGAPLAGLARSLAGQLPVPMVDGVSSAVRHAESMVALRPARAQAGSFGPLPVKPHRGLPDAIARLLDAPR